MNTNSRQVTLHIGLPKTATTTIQRHLFKNADYLRELGIDYCEDLCGDDAFSKAAAHHGLARACRPPQEVNLPAESNNVIRRRLSHSAQYLLSSEWFTRANAKGVRALVDGLGLPDQRQVVFVTRSEVAYIRSHWMQAIKMGKRSDSLWEYYSASYKPGRRQYSDKLRVWLDAGFSVVALRYEDLQSAPDVTHAFLRLLFEIEIDPARWQSIPNANVSPSHDAVAHYQRLFAPVYRVISPRVDQRKAAKWYKGAHDICCKNKLIEGLGACKQYREDLERIKEDILLLPDIDDLTYLKVH